MLISIRDTEEKDLFRASSYPWPYDLGQCSNTLLEKGQFDVEVVDGTERRMDDNANMLSRREK